MFDIPKLLRYYRRYSWLIILVPAVAVAITYYFVKDLPDVYQAQTVISTGMTDAAKYGGSALANQSRQTYSNMMGMVRMKRVMDKVSYRLALHDLENESNRFRRENPVLETMPASEKQALISTIRKCLAENIPLVPSDPAVKPVFDFISATGYDRGFLTNSMQVNRYGESDFLGITFFAEQPELAAFAANTLASEFIHYYEHVTFQSSHQSVSTLDSLLKEKERTMQEKNDLLRDYRVNSGVLNSSTHSGMLYQQVSSMETKRSDKLAEIESIQGAIADINRRLNDPNGGYSLSSTVEYNNEIVGLDRQLDLANKRYIDNNFQERDKQRIDSLQEVKRRVVANAAASGSFGNPRESRQMLQQQLVELQTQLSSARSSIRTIDAGLTAARARYSAMVPTDASLQNYERAAELATSEYMEALNRYNQAGFVSDVGTRLNIVELGLPGQASKSKKIMYMGLSGVSTLFLCLAVLTLLCLLNRRILNSDDLKLISGIDTIVCLNRVKTKRTNIRRIWEEAASNPQYEFYRDQLRTLRFDLNKELEKGKCGILAITSLGVGEGKSFVAGSLAYAFAMIGKKVLLIGEDTKVLHDVNNPSDKRESNESPAEQQFETFLIERKIQTEDLITNLQRNRNNSSILERQDNENLVAGFKLLREQFDLIIIDVGSFTSINQVKEWLMFSDVSLAVFEAGRTIDNSAIGYLGYLRQYPGFKGWVLNKVETDFSPKSA